PIGILVEALRGLGASIEYWKQDGYPPLHVVSKGRLRGGELRMRGDVSSQFISAVLMIAPVLAEGLSLELEGEITSRPYIEMTLGLMKKFGIQSSWTDHRITVPEQTYQAGEYRIESDWSAASYWYSVVALSDQASVMLRGLRQESFQGDQKVSELMRAFGVETQYLAEGIQLTKVESSPASMPSSIDFTEVPDLAQTLAVVAAALGHPLTLTGLHTLRVKETDRIEAVATELGKIGVDVSTGPDYLKVNDGVKGEAAQIHTYEDHRMAMAFAPLAVRFPGMVIDEPGVVVKSYPEYWDHLRLAGFVTQTLA
ncbi:MAG: 3-phosphoshikimate 1-carboxyvinyltransferase, partial [Bacteroidota bacterium]